MPPTQACPKCNRPLEASGTLTVDGQELPVFQCEHCTRSVGGIQIALTFCRLADGSLVDPGAPDQPLAL